MASGKLSSSQKKELAMQYDLALSILADVESAIPLYAVMGLLFVFVSRTLRRKRRTTIKGRGDVRAARRSQAKSGQYSAFPAGRPLKPQDGYWGDNY